MEVPQCRRAIQSIHLSLYSGTVVKVKVILIRLIKILSWIELPWKTLKVILLQEGSGMGNSQTAHGIFFISDLRL